MIVYYRKISADFGHLHAPSIIFQEERGQLEKFACPAKTLKMGFCAIFKIPQLEGGTLVFRYIGLLHNFQAFILLIHHYYQKREEGGQLPTMSLFV